MNEHVITDSERLLNIMRVMNDKTFGFRYSEKIVGGLIRAEKGNKDVQNGKWRCNASDVLRYAKIGTTR